MKKRKELERQLNEERKARDDLYNRYAALHELNMRAEVRIKELERQLKKLEAQVVSEKERYTTLLERYISMMERMANNGHSN